MWSFVLTNNQNVEQRIESVEHVDEEQGGGEVGDHPLRHDAAASLEPHQAADNRHADGFDELQLGQVAVPWRKKRTL